MHKVSDIFHIQLFSKFVVTVGAAELLDILDFAKIMKSYLKSKGKNWIIVHFFRPAGIQNIHIVTMVTF